MTTKSVYLAKDSGIDGDNISNSAKLALDSSAFNLASPIKYTLKSITGLKEKLIGKADTLLTGIDTNGEFLLPSLVSKTGFNDGVYKLSLTQDGKAELLNFTIDTKLPVNLTVSLTTDTGSSTKDKITNDATVTLGGLEKGASVEWRDSPTAEWQSIDPTLVTSLTVKGKTLTTVDMKTLLGEEFSGQAALEFRQTDVAGNSSANTAALTFLYDKQAPTLTDVVIPDSAILNGKSSSVRLISTEKLVGLDAKDFALSVAKLASITAVKESQTVDGHWAYDVTLTGAKTGSGDVDLTFSKTAAVTDVAGNALDLSGWSLSSLGSVEIGAGSVLSVGLVNDTGTKSDFITNDGTLKLANIKQGSSVEFQIKTGSESMPDGSEWLNIPADVLSIVNKSGTVNVEALYTLLLGDAFQPDANGWKDTFNFRSVDVNGNPSKTVTPLTLTYDHVAPEFVDVILPDSAILNSKTGVVRVLSTEKLVGLDAKDFALSSAKLASITAVKESQTVDGDWAYDVTLTGAKTGSGDVDLTFATTAAATDVAGNALDLSGWSSSLGSVEIGTGSVLSVGLVNDTGTKGDNVTSDGALKLGGIKLDSSLEVRVKPGSESMPDGSDWVAIDDVVVLNDDGKSGSTDIMDVYANLGIDFGFKDTFEFHQIDTNGKVSGATPLTLTYDNAPSMVQYGDWPETDFIDNGQSVTLQLTSDEKLFGFDKNDFLINSFNVDGDLITSALASITSIKEKQVVDEFDAALSYWTYDVAIKAATKGDGNVEISIKDDAFANDLAGNAADFSGIQYAPFYLWIGAA
jgi:hypothetical protein